MKPVGNDIYDEGNKRVWSISCEIRKVPRHQHVNSPYWKYKNIREVESNHNKHEESYESRRND